jgi:N utilization substance protein B
MNPAARHKARIYALQSLYEWLLSSNDVKSIETRFLADNDFSRVDADYFKDLLQGVTSKVKELDQQLVPYLDRPLKDLTQVELCILRIAVFELLHRSDVPFRVIINEAVELNKKFGSVEGFKFINGVLDRMAKVLRAEEIKQGAKN